MIEMTHEEAHHVVGFVCETCWPPMGVVQHVVVGMNKEVYEIRDVVRDVVRDVEVLVALLVSERSHRVVALVANKLCQGDVDHL